MKKGFNNKKYVNIQSKKIKERIKKRFRNYLLYQCKRYRKK